MAWLEKDRTHLPKWASLENMEDGQNVQSDKYSI